MEVFILTADSDKYRPLVIPGSLRNEEVAFDGRSRRDEWTPVYVKMSEAKKKWAIGDFPSLGRTAPVFSRRAAEALRDPLCASGELLPLACDEGDYYVYNVTRVLTHWIRLVLD